MSNELTHHGIKDQKWGLRRFQNPDGSLTPAGRERYGVGKERGTTSSAEQTKSPKSSSLQKDDTQSTASKSKRKINEMSDDELRARINRLNMEEQYRNLVARQKEASRSPAKKAFLKVLDKARDMSLDYIVTKAVGKITGQGHKDIFDIDDYKDMDVYKMDGDTIKAVADWYTKAGLITKQREAISSDKKKD